MTLHAITIVHWVHVYCSREDQTLPLSKSYMITLVQARIHSKIMQPEGLHNITTFILIDTTAICEGEVYKQDAKCNIWGMHLIQISLVSFSFHICVPRFISSTWLIWHNMQHAYWKSPAQRHNHPISQKQISSCFHTSRFYGVTSIDMKFHSKDYNYIVESDK